MYKYEFNEYCQKYRAGTIPPKVGHTDKVKPVYPLSTLLEQGYTNIPRPAINYVYEDCNFH